MKKSMFGLIIMLVLVGACQKKTPTPAIQVQPQAVQVVPTPTPESKPFVIPPAAKKQQKYYPEGTPSRAIQDLDDMLDSYILDPKTPEEKKYNADLKRAVLHGTFDIRELCMLSLDKHWGERSVQEQDYFVDLMERLLEKKAIFSKEQGQKKKKTKSVYAVTYEGHKFLNPDKSNSVAMSLVHIPSENLKIELNYKLKKEAEAWKVYDVIVDGASLLDNYKYQFDKIIDKDGYPDLVHRMESKLKDLEENDQTESVGG